MRPPERRMSAITIPAAVPSAITDAVSSIVVATPRSTAGSSM